MERISENNRIKEDVGEILVMAYYNQGKAHFGLKHYKEAIEDYSKAIEINPKDTEAYDNRGNVYLRLNHYKEAIEDCNKAIELNPKFAKCYMNRGLTHLQANEDLDNAIEDFKRARDLSEGKEKDSIFGFIE